MKKTTRLIQVGALAATALMFPAAVAAEQPTKGGCPSGTWVLNGPSEWLEATLAGMVAEGTTVEEQAALFGFANVTDFENWIIEGVFGEGVGLDANGDGKVCRSTNTPSGYPEFYFQAHDNKYHAKFVS